MAIILQNGKTVWLKGKSVIVNRGKKLIAIYNLLSEKQAQAFFFIFTELWQ
jgi:hypothetical protein